MKLVQQDTPRLHIQENLGSSSLSGIYGQARNIRTNISQVVSGVLQSVWHVTTIHWLELNLRPCHLLLAVAQDAADDQRTNSEKG
tara:strand:- start:92 stop:346 length:255 start_codon:yes stop_codon:yes gene_type:complete